MDYFTFQDWFHLYVPPASLPQPQVSSEAIGQQQLDSPRYLSLTPSQTPPNNGVLYTEHNPDHFAQGDDDDPVEFTT